MALSKQEIDALLRMVERTQDAEIDCEQCLALVSEFAEQQLAGRAVPEGLAAVEQHLAVCGECREEYAALREALQHLDRPDTPDP